MSKGLLPRAAVVWALLLPTFCAVARAQTQSETQHLRSASIRTPKAGELDGSWWRESKEDSIEEPDARLATTAPTKKPTRSPTKRPTKAPTKAPTIAPTQAPTTAATSTPTTATPSPAPGIPSLGDNANLNGFAIFPSSNAWNQAVDTLTVDPNSATILTSIGLTASLKADFGANWNGGPFGIPYVVVSGSQAKVPMSFDYADESDAGPYPIPPNAPIEGGASSTGDRHILVLDRDNKLLYETWSSYPDSATGGWACGSGAIFNVTSGVDRPAGWTSADAAGLPILPGLVRYEEVASGQITHAVRFTVSTTRKAYVYPARHFASSNTSPSLPPMGMRVRLKASFDVSAYPASVKVILQALKKYGMILADNGSSIYISGVPDSRWNDDELATLRNVKASDLEVVQMGTIVTA